MDHTEEHVQVEPEGIQAGSILVMVLGICVALAVVVVFAVNMSLTEFESAGVAASETTGYPQLRETRAAAQALLSQTGPADAEAGIYRIPIESAMQQVVRESEGGSPAHLKLTR